MKKSEFICTNTDCYRNQVCDTAQKSHRSGIKYIRYPGGDECTEFKELPYKHGKTQAD